jgi:class 3 adenylate cyclase/tetratricopeptide (TPR) repeat protein
VSSSRHRTLTCDTPAVQANLLVRGRNGGLPDADHRGAAPYAPRLALRWLATEPDRRHRRVDGSLLFADISGFTRLSERLAGRGRVGAEEIVGIVGDVLTALIGELEERDGDVLVFAGDALIALFEGEEGAARAARSGAAIRRWLATRGAIETSVGRVALRVSIGISTGPVDLVLAGDDERAVYVTGSTTSAMVAMERAAEAGEILLDPATAGVLDPRWLGAAKGAGRLLRRTTPIDWRPDAARSLPGVDPTVLIPRSLRAHLATPGAPAVESEHRIATIAFLVVGGLDERFATEPQAAAGDLDALHRLVAAAAARHDVTLLGPDVASDGATIFLAAGAPATSGEDEERMLRCLREVLDAPVASRLAARAGCARGPVFAGDVGAPRRRTYTAMGDTTNLAARIAARAAPGDLLATSEVLARASTEFSSEPRESFRPKGKREDVLPYAVGAPGRPQARTADVLPLVGRDTELGSLTEALGRARAGRGGLVEIVGEAGSGKSRLLQAIRDEAGEVVRFVVRCAAAEASTPYDALRAALLDLLGVALEAGPDEVGAALVAWEPARADDVAPWIPLIAIPFGATVPSTETVDRLAPAFRRARLHDAMAMLLGRAMPDLTLFELEDIHWADEATLALFDALVDNATARPWLICALRRPGPEPFPGRNPTRIELTGLPNEAVAALAAASAGTALSDASVQAIVARAAGNPLFVRELAAATAAGRSSEDLPERLEVLLASRIDRLDAPDRGLLRRAAVGGRTIDLDVLSEVLRDEGPDVRDAAAWGRLDEFVGWTGPSELRFRHDLIRDAAYAGLSHANRRTLHRRLAEALEERAGEATDELAGVLATHFARGGLPDRAFAYGRRAGDLARARYANVDAAALYADALAAGAAADVPPGDLAGVAEALGDVAELAGRYDQSLEAYARARAMVRSDPSGRSADPVSVAGLARKTGIVCERAGRYAEALGWYSRGRRVLAEDGATERSRALAIRLQLDAAGVRYRQGRYQACVGEALPAAAAAEAAGERALLANAYYLLHGAYSDLGSPEVARYRDLALPIYEEIGDLVGQGNVLNNLGIDAYFEGRWDEALALYARSKDAKVRVGDVARAATQSNNEAEILSDQGRFSEAEALLQDALRIWSAAGYEIGVALATSNLGRAAARGGRVDEGLALLDEATRRFERIRADGYVDETRARVAEALVLAGRPGEAVSVADATLQHVRREAATSILGAQLERTLGHASLQLGDAPTAGVHFDESLRQARALDASFEVALTLLALVALPGRDPGARSRDEVEATTLLAGLGVTAVPEVPMPTRST